MDAIHLRKKQVSAMMKDVVICCQHSDKFFTEMNGCLVEKSCHFFSQQI